MTTHITYKTAKALKEFLGADMPLPMGDTWYDKYGHGADFSCPIYPRYFLHDLLSKPFAEAFVKRGGPEQGYTPGEIVEIVEDWSRVVGRIYFNEGLEGVEKMLVKMIGKEG